MNELNELVSIFYDVMLLTFSHWKPNRNVHCTYTKLLYSIACSGIKSLVFIVLPIKTQGTCIETSKNAISNLHFVRTVIDHCLSIILVLHWNAHRSRRIRTPYLFHSFRDIQSSCELSNILSTPPPFHPAKRGSFSYEDENNENNDMEGKAIFLNGKIITVHE